MLTPFVKILEKYRRDSFSEADKGSRFEELIREYLWNDPKYSIFFNEIWLWREFPFRRYKRVGPFYRRCTIYDWWVKRWGSG